MKGTYRLLALVVVLALTSWMGSFEVAQAGPPPSCGSGGTCSPESPGYYCCSGPGSEMWYCECLDYGGGYRWYCGL